MFCNALSLRASALRAIVFFLLSLVLFTPSAHAKVAGKSLFEASEIFSSDTIAFTKWRGMRDRFSDQKKLPEEMCSRIRFHPCIGTEWEDLIEAQRGKPLSEQMQRINGFGNAHAYTTDQVNWGMEDYWETPVEFLTVNGDCEDYAIMKYYSLRALGVPASHLRIIIVQDLNLGGIIHAVLGVYDGGSLYLLDNQIKQVVRASQVYHYKPVYAINEEGWWAYHVRS